MIRIVRVLCVLLICKGCTPATEKAEISLFAAASLNPVLKEIARNFEQKRGIPVNLNAASSGTLARQIAQGAPADLFISANQQWLTFLFRDELVLSESTLPIRNQLVLIAPLGSELENLDISRTEQTNPILARSRIAIGDPNHVPVGQYAAQAIEAMNWHFAPQQILQAKDARATLVAVELGEADLGIVYQTDAKKSKKVKIIATIPDDAYTPIQYFAGTCSNHPLTAEFLNFLKSADAEQIWKKHGFVL